MDSFAWRVVRADFTSSHGFRWPFPGGVAEAPGPCTTGGPCPSAPGDGLCLARTPAGAAGGGIPLHVVLVCAYDPADVLGEDDTKLRVRRARVVDVWDAHRLIRTYGAGATLQGANLQDATLEGALGLPAGCCAPEERS